MPLSHPPPSGAALPTHPFLLAIINFTPSWFSVNMGTGILSILFVTIPYSFYGLTTIATIFYILNIVLFLVFLALTIARYVLYPWVFTRMLKHSSQSLFVGTLPMGLATIVNATVLIAVPTYGDWALNLAWALWWLDVALSILSCFGIPIVMFHMHTLSLDKMTAAWLLPVVPTVVAAASGGVMATVLSPNDAFITLMVSYALWGIGMSLSFLIMAIYLHRLAMHKLPTGEVIVSAFLPLGPLGQGAFGILEMASAGKKAFLPGFAGVSTAADIVFVISTLVALILWGFGLWWLVHGISSVCIRRATSGPLQSNMGFWGFIFPLGVFNSGTIALGNAIPSAFFAYLSVVFLFALCILYFFVASVTIHGVFTGKLLVAPCLGDIMPAKAPRPPETSTNNVTIV
jgi:C4-dicarboxylate transporter/malic acid transport protein